MEFYVSQWKFGHSVVITEGEKTLYREPLSSFIGSELASILKIEIKDIDKYGFITYSVLNSEEVLKILKNC